MLNTLLWSIRRTPNEPRHNPGYDEGTLTVKRIIIFLNNDLDIIYKICFLKNFGNTFRIVPLLVRVILTGAQRSDSACKPTDISGEGLFKMVIKKK